MVIRRLLSHIYSGTLALSVTALLAVSFVPQERVDDVRDFIARHDVLGIGRSLVRGAHVATASQGSACMPTTGTVSGLVFAQDVNAAIAALLTSNSGASAPSNDCSAAAVKGQVWLDTSSTPNILKQYDGTSWLVLGYLDTSNHVWTPPLGGGTTAIASATTTDLWSVQQAAVTVTGTTGITALANSSAVAGTLKIMKFAGALTLTYDASTLILPGAANITTSAGDYALVMALTSSNVAVVQYFKADGTAVVNPAMPVGTIRWSSAFSPEAKELAGYGQAIARSSYPDYVTKNTSVQSVTRTSGSAVLTGFSDITQFGAGMPIEGTGIPAATTLLSCSSSSCTMSANASSSGTSNATVFLTGYGAGGTSSTIGVFNCSGVGIAGRDNMSGTSAGNLTPTYFGASSTALNSIGGLQYQQLLTNNLPAYTPSGNNAPSAVTGISIPGTGQATLAGSGAAPVPSISGGGVNGWSLSGGTGTAATQTWTGSAQGGTSAPFSIVPPTRIANCFVRVLSMHIPHDDAPLMPAANDNARIARRRIG